MTTDTTVTLSEEQYIEENGKSYLLVDGHKLKLRGTALERLDLEKHQEYNLVYSYNKWFPKKGKVDNLTVYGDNFKP